MSAAISALSTLKFSGYSLIFSESFIDALTKVIIILAPFYTFLVIRVIVRLFRKEDKSVKTKEEE